MSLNNPAALAPPSPYAYVALSTQAVSRLDLKGRLLRRGPHLLDHELGLDSQDFRLVCIPFDAYCRLAPAFGWGHRELWTHFDGYQV